MGEERVEQRGLPRGLTGLADRLRKISVPPLDADSLVQIVDRRCGHNIEFGLFDLDPRLPDYRKDTLKRLKKIKKEVSALFRLHESTGAVDPVNWALPWLVLEQDPLKSHHLCASLYQALAKIDDFPLVPNGNAYAKRPSASERLSELLRALGEYLRKFEKTDFTVDITEDSGGRMIFNSRAAYLARALSDELHLGIPDTELRTNLNKVRLEIGKAK